MVQALTFDCVQATMVPQHLGPAHRRRMRTILLLVQLQALGLQVTEVMATVIQLPVLILVRTVLTLRPVLVPVGHRQ